LLKSKKGKIISYILRFAVAAAALYIAFHKVNFAEVAQDFKGLGYWYLFAGIAGWLGNQILFVARWVYLLRVQSIHIKYWVAFRLHILGIFYNNCLPSAVGGDFIRAWYVTNHTDKKVQAAVSVFVDRMIGISGMVLMAVFCYWLIPVPTSDSQGATAETTDQPSMMNTLLSYWWAPVVAVGLIILIILVLMLIPSTRKKLTNAFNLLRNKGRAMFNKVTKALVVYCNMKLALFFALLMTFVCQGVFIVGLYFIGQGLGLQSPAKYYFVFFPLTWMIGAIPVSFAGFGVWEASLTGMFVAVGDTADDAAGLALFHRAVWLFGSLPGVVIHLCGAHLPKDISIDYNEADS